ncbi:hypothetical protein H5T51_03080 [Candidatus Bathyarchaeota archaeon]|nr:hypothetical protein [Candidatus Bathyarchaeota archaeon]
MTTKREQARTGREKLQHIIEVCKSIEERSLDPFLVDVDEIIKVLREYFPCWEQPKDLCLDAEALHHIASVIKLQSDWVKSRSTSLYTDPFLLEGKIKSLSKEKMVEIFLRAWHPIIEMEQLTIQSISEALRYWKELAPIGERWQDLPQPEPEAKPATREELIKENILRDEAFTEELEKLWEELKQKVKASGINGKIRYWDLIGAKTYEETVHKAFIASFLVTYGYADLEIHPLEMEIYIKPHENPVKRKTGKQLVSIPISISREEWKKWREKSFEQKESILRQQTEKGSSPSIL